MRYQQVEQHPLIGEVRGERDGGCRGERDGGCRRRACEPTDAAGEAAALPFHLLTPTKSFRYFKHSVIHHYRVGLSTIEAYNNYPLTA